MPRILREPSRRKQRACATLRGPKSGTPDPDQKEANTIRMDHISVRGCVGDVHYGSVHKPIPIPEGMKIPDAKVAANKEWDKLKV